MDINEYIEVRFKNQREFYSNGARTNKSISLFYQRSIIMLGAAIPVTVALFGLIPGFLDVSDCKTQNLLNSISIVLSAVFSACITVFVALDKLNQPMQNWYNYRNIAELLKKEEYYFHFSAGPYANMSDEQKALAFVERIEQTVSSDINRFLQSSNQNQTNNSNEPNTPPLVVV